jgi:ribosomal protein S18 acetylase RimI-like enzyme
MAIEIRKPKIKEWESYKTLRLESLQNFPLAFATSYQESLNDVDEKWMNYIKSSLENKESIMLCAFSEDKIVGSVTVIWSNRIKTKHVAQLVGMFVSPEFQRQGIGKKLVSEAIEELRKLSQFIKVKLDVVSENDKAIKLYENAGFKKVGELHKELFIDGKYYDLITMERFF